MDVDDTRYSRRCRTAGASNGASTTRSTASPWASRIGSTYRGRYSGSSLVNRTTRRADAGVSSINRVSPPRGAARDDEAPPIRVPLQSLPAPARYRSRGSSPRTIRGLRRVTRRLTGRRTAAYSDDSGTE
jgi:hypothetical protein